METGLVQLQAAEFKTGFYPSVTWFAVKKQKNSLQVLCGSFGGRAIQGAWQLTAAGGRELERTAKGRGTHKRRRKARFP